MIFKEVHYRSQKASQSFRHSRAGGNPFAQKIHHYWFESGMEGLIGQELVREYDGVGVTVDFRLRGNEERREWRKSTPQIFRLIRYILYSKI